MDASNIELPGCEVDSLAYRDGELRIHFSRAYILKTQTGSVERTRWWQAGDLVIQGLDAPPELPSGPLTAAGGDLYDNIYTYRDMIPIPLETGGRVGCKLRFEGIEAPVEAWGSRMFLEMEATPRYIEHIRPGTD